MNYIDDYLTGKKALVVPTVQAATTYQILLNYLTGQPALVLIQGAGAPPIPDSFFFPMFFNHLIPQ